MIVQELQADWPYKRWLVGPDGAGEKLNLLHAGDVGNRIGEVDSWITGPMRCIDKQTAARGNGALVTCLYEPISGDQGKDSMPTVPPYRGPNTPKPDPVNSPPHYTEGGIETIDFIEAKRLGYHLGNAVKYISRCQYKGARKTDVRKAIWYLERYLKTIETENGNG